MKKILLIIAVLSISALAQNNKVATDGANYFVKCRAGAGDTLTGLGQSRCLMSLVEGYVKVQCMKGGNVKDTFDYVFYLNAGIPLPISFVRKVYALYNGTDSCQTKIYIGNTLYTGLYVGQ